MLCAHLVGAALGTLTIGNLVVHTSCHRELQVLVEVVVQLEEESVAGEIVVGHQTGIEVVCAREVELGLVSTALHTYVVALGKDVLTEQVLLPVDGLNTFVEIEIIENTELFVERIELTLASQSRVLIVGHHILIGIKYVYAFGDLFCLQIAVVVDLCFPCLRILGGDEDNTIGTLRTVDSGGGSVLKYCDVFDVVGGEVAN